MSTKEWFERLKFGYPVFLGLTFLIEGIFLFASWVPNAIQGRYDLFGQVTLDKVWMPLMLVPFGFAITLTLLFILMGEIHESDH